MDDLRKLAKRKIMESLILSLLIIVFCIFNFGVNIDTYKKVIFDDYTIVNNYEELSSAKVNNDNFIIIDLSNAGIEHYKLDEKANIYTLILDGKKILVLLKENTVLTDKVNVQIIKQDEFIQDIEKKLYKNTYDDIILSNINYNRDIDIIKYKVYVIGILTILSLISILINLIKLIKPEKTKYYKKINSKYYN